MSSVECINASAAYLSYKTDYFDSLIKAAHLRRDSVNIYRSHALRHCPQLRKNYYKANAYVDKSPLTPLYKGGGVVSSSLSSLSSLNL